MTKLTKQEQNPNHASFQDQGLNEDQKIFIRHLEKAVEELRTARSWAYAKQPNILIMDINFSESSPIKISDPGQGQIVRLIYSLIRECRHKFRKSNRKNIHTLTITHSKH